MRDRGRAKARIDTITIAPSSSMASRKFVPYVNSEKSDLEAMLNGGEVCKSEVQS